MQKNIATTFTLVAMGGMSGAVAATSWAHFTQGRYDPFRNEEITIRENANINIVDEGGVLRAQLYANGARRPTLDLIDSGGNVAASILVGDNDIVAIRARSSQPMGPEYLYASFEDIILSSQKNVE